MLEIRQKIKKMILKNHSLKAVKPSVIMFIRGAKEYVVGITKMAIKWPSLHPWKNILLQKALYGVRGGKKQIWLKYVEYLQRLWHFSPLPNLRLTRYWLARCCGLVVRVKTHVQEVVGSNPTKDTIYYVPLIWIKSITA
jgi:hypothetical protein